MWFLAEMAIPDWAKAALGWVIKGAAALAVAFGAFKFVEHKGAVKERARVESTGAKIDAKAQAKRANAAANPDQALQRYWRD